MVTFFSKKYRRVKDIPRNISVRNRVCMLASSTWIRVSCAVQVRNPSFVGVFFSARIRQHLFFVALVSRPWGCWPPYGSSRWFHAPPFMLSGAGLSVTSLMLFFACSAGLARVFVAFQAPPSVPRLSWFSCLGSRPRPIRSHSHSRSRSLSHSRGPTLSLCGPVGRSQHPTSFSSSLVQRST